MVQALEICFYLLLILLFGILMVVSITMFVLGYKWFLEFFGNIGTSRESQLFSKLAGWLKTEAGNLPFRLFLLLPEPVRKLFEEDHPRLGRFIEKYHKPLFYPLFLIPMAIYPILELRAYEKSYPPGSSLVIMLFVIGAISLPPLFKSLIWRLSHDRVFAVCPNCGFSNFDLTDICLNCRYSHAEHGPVTADFCPTLEDAGEEGEESRLPAAIARGLDLEGDEEVLASETLHPSKKNGTRLLLNRFVTTSPLNYAVLTDRRLFLISYRYGGWLMMEDYPLALVYDYDFMDRVAPDISGRLGNIDRLRLRVEGNEFILQGKDPEKFFEKVVEQIKRNREGAEGNG